MSTKSNRFESATIILPVLNETDALKTTVELIKKTTDNKDIREFIFVVCDRTTDEALSAVREVSRQVEPQGRIHFQKLPFVGGAIREAFDLAAGSHVVMMSSDLETPPEVIPKFIRLARKNPDDIITASRWLKDGGFAGYNPLKLIANYIFQKIFSLLYRCQLTDMTYAYRIFPADLIKSINWEELKHPFFLETIIKPLRLGVDVHEVPAVWVARDSGESANSFFQNFHYFKVAIRGLLISKKRILKPNTF